MQLRHLSVRMLLAFILCASKVFAGEGIAVPGQVQFGGRVLTAEGTEAIAGVHGVTFALYAEQSGGNALWMETQNVSVDASGAYNALLGAETAGGIPQDIFASGEARWLEVSYTDAQGATIAQPRVLLVSVPYAMKAGDAQTLGGLPASAFVLNPNALSARVSAAGGVAAAGDVLPAAAVAGTGTANKIAKWIDGTGTLGDSLLFDNGFVVGLGTTTPSAALHISLQDASIILGGAGTHSLSVQGTGSNGRLGQDNDGFFFSSDTNGKALKMLTQSNNVLQEWMRITAGGQIGMGTQTPGAALHLSQQDASFLIDGAGTHSIAIQGPGSNGRFGQDGEGMFFASDTNGRAFKFLTNNGALNEWMRITSAGNVGVGTTTPSQKLHVVGNILTTGTETSAGVVTSAFTMNVGASLSGKVLTSDANGVGTWQAPTGGGATLGANTFTGDQTINGNATVSNNLTVDTTTLTVDATNHRVGVGTNLPSQTLDVNGSVRVRTGGSLVMDSGTTLNCTNCITSQQLADNLDITSGTTSFTAGDITVNGSITINEVGASPAKGPTQAGMQAEGPVTASITGGQLKFGTKTLVGTGGVMGFDNNGTSPNLVFGYGSNTIDAGVYGAVIGGGGAVGSLNSDPLAPNHVTDLFGTIGGGAANLAGNNTGVVNDANFPTVGGGYKNTASSLAATVSGGYNNTASNGYASVIGGCSNVANGIMSTVVGGCDNQATGLSSLAGGSRSRANHDGTFVWTDQSVVAQFASTAVNQFLIRAAGGVGLGVNNPGYQLDVGNRMRVRQGTNGTAGVWFYQTTPAADRGFVGMVNDNAIGLYGNAGAGWGLSMNVADGKVGVGTTSPSADLHVVGVENDGTAASLKVTSGAQTLLMDGNEIDSAAGLFLNHNTTANVIIGDGGGLVGINDSTPADKLDVDGNIRITGCLWTGSTVYSGTCVSDIRYKQNVETLHTDLNRITALRPVAFDWRAEEFPEKHFEPGRSHGLIAQEVEQVLPEMVSTDENGYKAVNYSELPLLAIQAIKELKAENDALRAELAAAKEQSASRAELSELRELVLGMQRQLGTQVSKVAR